MITRTYPSLNMCTWEKSTPTVQEKQMVFPQVDCTSEDLGRYGLPARLSGCHVGLRQYSEGLLISQSYLLS